MSGKGLRVGVDLAVFRPPLTGIGNYQHGLLSAIVALDPEIALRGFNFPRWLSVDASYLSEIEKKTAHFETGLEAGKLHLVDRLAHETFVWARSNKNMRRMRDHARARIFAHNSQKQDLDLFHAFTYRPPGRASCPIIPVVHDLSTERFPNTHPEGRLRWMEPVRALCEAAPLIHTVSNFSAEEIVEVYGIARDRIRVIHPGINPLFVDPTPVNEGGLERLNLTQGSFLLCVSTIEPRKNLRSLIAAYAQTPQALRQHNPLVVVGAKGWGEANFPAVTDMLLSEGSLRFTGFVSNRALKELYQGARALFYPSIYEGFGMPITEALACGTPVVASGVSSMPEAGGAQTRLVDPLDIDSWTKELVRAMDSDTDLDPTARSARQHYASQFTWEKAARETIAMYHSALEN